MWYHLLPWAVWGIQFKLKWILYYLELTDPLARLIRGERNL